MTEGRSEDMQAKKRILMLVTLMLILSVLTAACATEATPEPEEPSKPEVPAEATEAPTAEPEAEEQVTITFWHIYGPEMAGANSWFADTIEGFQAKYPNITIEEEITPNDPYKVKLKTAIAAGEAADAFMVYPGGWTEPYAKDGAIMPVDKYLDQAGWRDTYISSAFDELTWDGQVYGFPLALRTVHIWYNKDVFDEYGLTPPGTFAGLKEIIQTLVDNGVTPFALGNKERWQGNFWASYLFDRVGGYEAWYNAVNRLGEGWADPSHVEALTLLQDLVKMGAFTEGTNGVGAMDVNQSFFDGQAAMILNGTFFVDQVKSLGPEGFLDEKLGYFNFPVIEGGKGSITDYHGGVGSAFVINSKTEHPDEVAAFYNYMMSPENLTELAARTNWVMTVKDTIPEDASDLLLSLANEAAKMEHLIWYADHAMVPAVFEVYADATQAVFGLSITPEEAVQQMEEAAIKEYGH
jgi:raffinose/stachyose/melibiose transport system substrate-binding protein